MSQLSKRKMNQNVGRKVNRLIVEALVACPSQKVAEEFLSGVLTHTEYVMIAKRLGIAVLLDDGKSYSQIKSLLKVSTPTIARVSNQLHIQNKGYLYILRRLKKLAMTMDILEYISNSLVETLTLPGKGRSNTTLRRIRRGL